MVFLGFLETINIGEHFNTPTSINGIKRDEGGHADHPCKWPLTKTIVRGDRFACV
jgi:hypothetical protein